MVDDTTKNNPGPDDQGTGKEGDQQKQAAEKMFSKIEVEDIVSKRVSKMAAEIAEKEKRLAALESAKREGDKAGKSEMQLLKDSLTELNKRADAAEAEAKILKLSEKKRKMAEKAGLPQSWKSHAHLIPGETDEDIAEAIKAIKEDAKDETAPKKKQLGFVPAGGNGGKATANDYMNNAILTKMNRNVISR
jgi:hypothetical protein